MSSFVAHGSISVKVDGRVLIVEGTGPWNAESLDESGENAKGVLESLKGAPWGVIVVVRGEPIHVPDAAKQLTQIIRDEKRVGRSATALLVEDSDSPRFAKNHIGEIYREAGENFAFFSDFNHAKAWVLDKVKQAELV
ncbi:hypothetical protein OE749_14345 [Aestuariibacter sp. AA17]|uniref:STAS/SEC14 domain-containing protein n=1 Tax=Fluctibacter corallii TaxID=2984329 RepID=A0ABT3ABB1_9ALTE|nr:hypothetical protein [Aestuariibacter sp. AA17]MCV2885875.1 hypothetical protein [Aestuariibacter sp. AA17]